MSVIERVVLALLVSLAGDKLILAQELPELPRQATRKDLADGIRSGTAEPSREEVFRPEEDKAFRTRIRRTLKPQTGSTEMPETIPPSTSLGHELHYVSDPHFVTAVPIVVCHRPLYFEQTGPERYGQSIPLFQPMISAARFYLDVAVLPVKVIVQPPWTFESSTNDPSPNPQPIPTLPR